METKQCVQCLETKPLNEFYRRTSKTDGHMKTCMTCYLHNLHETLLRRAVFEQQRKQQEELERQRQEEAARLLAEERQRKEAERQRTIAVWLSQQPDRRCVACGVIKPVSDFGYNTFVDDLPKLRQRCHSCHQEMLERNYLPCCLCGRKTHRDTFLDYFQGYRLDGGGTVISLCCKPCRPAFLALPEEEQRRLVSACCDRKFPAGQVIYALVDPETQQIRYVGRTGNSTDRYKAHLRQGKVPDLSDRGLKPTMTILKTVEMAPLVVEWERRYICHGIQQGWPLLNIETTDAGFVARIQATSVDFIHAPFETLVEQSIFTSNGLEAFVRAWYAVRVSACC